MYRYDVALSFAGQDRQIAERFAMLLRQRGVKVFYDLWEQTDLLGKDLYQHVDAVYRVAARYCVIFVSEHYARRPWTKHELKSAQARALEENSEYILPIRLDDTELPGLLPTIVYLDSRKLSLSEMCAIVVSKIGIQEIKIAEQLDSTSDNDRIRALSKIAIHRSMEHLNRAIELMLSDQSDIVREKAAWVVDNLNDPRAAYALLRAIHDPCWGVRSNAGWALVHLGNVVRSDVEQIVRTSSNTDAREMATLILQRL